MVVGFDVFIFLRILFYLCLLRVVFGDGISGGFGIWGLMDFVLLEKVVEDIVNVVVEVVSSI